MNVSAFSEFFPNGRVFIVALFLMCGAADVSAETLFVGDGQAYGSITAAARDVRPGDTILVLEGIWTRRESVSDLRGRADAPIVIMAEPGKRLSFVAELKQCISATLPGCTLSGLSVLDRPVTA